MFSLSWRDGGVLCLAYSDPASKNSLSVAAARELQSLLRGRVSTAKAFVLTAHGRVFCSGGNLTDYAQMNEPNEGLNVNREITEILNRIAGLEIPTVCAVSGDCFGGGVELVSAFDEVLASPHVIFALWQRRIALTFGWGGGARLEKRVGPQKLMQLARSTQSLTAEEAQRIGLIDRVVLDTALLNTAVERAQMLSRLPKAPLSSLKKWTSENEAETFHALWWNEEHRAVLSRRNKS